MNFLLWSSESQVKGPPKYNPMKDFIITYNISGTTFSFSYLTLKQHKESNLYNYAYKTSKTEFIFDKDGFIYLDMCPVIFQHIHDFVKGYDLRLQDMDIKTKTRILRDAEILKIKKLIDVMKLEMPQYSNDIMNKWANIIAKSLISTGINIENMVESCSGNKLKFPLSNNLKTILETNPVIRNKIKNCVKEIMETQVHNKNSVDSIILNIVMEMSKDTTFQELLENLLSNYL